MRLGCVTQSLHGISEYIWICPVMYSLLATSVLIPIFLSSIGIDERMLTDEFRDATRMYIKISAN